MLVILRGLSELSLKRIADRCCRKVRRNGGKGASLGQRLQEQETGRDPKGRSQKEKAPPPSSSLVGVV